MSLLKVKFNAEFKINVKISQIHLGEFVNHGLPVFEGARGLDRSLNELGTDGKGMDWGRTKIEDHTSNTGIE